jgi:hypothetical protein
MSPKTRFMIHVPGRTDIGCDTAEQVSDALNDLKNTEGVTVADLQTGLRELTREVLEELARTWGPIFMGFDLFRIFGWAARQAIVESGQGYVDRRVMTGEHGVLVA